jgi:hypothetical protein
MEIAEPASWSAFSSRYAALLAEPLTPASVPAWLARWSDLEKAVWDGRGVRKLAMYKDRTSVAAEGAYRTYLAEVMAPFRMASQALIAKALALPGYTPALEHEQIMRRWRSSVDLVKPEVVRIQLEISALEDEYRRIARQIREASADTPGPTMAHPVASALFRPLRGPPAPARPRPLARAPGPLPRPRQMPRRPVLCGSLP